MNTTGNGGPAKLVAWSQADRQAELDALATLPRGLYREQKVTVERPVPKRL
jgi:hypothetical protein